VPEVSKINPSGTIHSPFKTQAHIVAITDRSARHIDLRMFNSAAGSNPGGIVLSDNSMRAPDSMQLATVAWRKTQRPVH
jgi:hypothetical protein